MCFGRQAWRSEEFEGWCGDGLALTLLLTAYSQLPYMYPFNSCLIAHPGGLHLLALLRCAVGERRNERNQVLIRIREAWNGDLKWRLEMRTWNEDWKWKLEMKTWNVNLKRIKSWNLDLNIEWTSLDIYHISLCLSLLISLSFCPSLIPSITLYHSFLSLSLTPSTYPSIHPSIYPSVFLSMHPLTHPIFHSFNISFIQYFIHSIFHSFNISLTYPSKIYHFI